MNSPRPGAGSPPLSPPPLWLRVVLVAGAYGLVALVGQRLIVNPEKIAIFWPASGLLLGVLLLSPGRDWRWLLAGTLLADVWVGRWGGYSWSLAVAYGTINQGEALLGAWFLQRRIGPGSRLGGVAQLLLLVIAAAVSGALTATAGAAVTVWVNANPSFWGVWYFWWLSVLLGVLSVTPLLLALASLRRPLVSTFSRRMEALALLLGTGAVTALIFSRDPLKGPVALSLLYAPFPFLIWAALRFQVAGAAIVSFLLASLAVAWTAFGLGPMMLIERTTAQRIIWLQAYLGIASFTALALAAGVAERERAREALRESERKTRAILDQTFQFIGLCQTDGSMVEANESSLQFAGIRLDQVVGRPCWETPWWSHSPVEQQRVREAITRAAAGELVRFETTHRAPDGSLHTIDFSLKPIRDEDGRIVWLISEGRDITDRKRLEEIHEVMRELAQQLTAPLSMKELGAVVARQCQRLFAFDAFLIYAVDSRTGHRRAVHAEDTPEGHSAPMEMTAEFETGTSVLISSVVEGQSKVINRHTLEEGPPTAAWGFKARRSRSLLFVPIQWEGRCVGVITVQSYTPAKYAQADLDLLQTIANQCGGALMRIQAELALRHNERRLFQFLEASPVGVLVINQQGEIYFLNQNAKTILGTESAVQAGPEPLTQFYQACLAGTGQPYPVERQPIARALRGERSSVDDMEIHRPDRMVPIQVWAAPIFDDCGQVTFAIAAFADITERRRAQDELRASEEKFSKAFVSSPDSIVITLLEDGRIIEVNGGFEQLFGVPAAEAIGRTKLELGIWRDEQQRATTIERLRRDGSIRNLEVVLQNRSGQPLTCLISVEAIELGNQRCMVGITRDITEQKKAEDEVRRLNAELEARVLHRTADLETALRELESFSYSVSHDLRAPLRHVSGFASLLLESPVLKKDPGASRQVQSIVSAAKKMGELIDDLLLFSRMGRTEMHAGRIDLPTLVAQSRQEAGHEAGDRQIDWRIGPLPDVQGDHAMLRLVFQNLLANAVKYTRDTPQAIIEIGARRGAGEHILFVRDNGAGFDMQYAGKLFGVFQRLHSEEEFEGTGIGLANVRRIIQRHGGRTWAEGSVGQGATFYFSLPA